MLRHSNRVRMFLRSLENRLAPANISWDGGGANDQWFTAANWTGDVVPGAGDDVTINASMSIYYNGVGAKSINSLDIQACYLLVDGGQLTISNGLSIAPSWNLQCNNVGSSITVNGATKIDGAGVYAQNSSTVTLNGLTSQAGSNAGSTSLIATNSGKLNLPILASITGTPSANFVHVRAFSGATVSMPALTSLTSGYVEMRADDAGSVISAPNLATIDFPNDTYGNFGAQNGGSFVASPSLTKIDRVNLYISGSSFPTSQLTDISGSTVFVNGGTTSFNNVTNLTGSSIYAQGGASVTFNSLTSVTGSVDYATFCQADSGGTLSFPNLTKVNANQNQFMYFRSYDGGTLTMNSVTKIDTGYVEIRAQDAGSFVNASGLATFTFPTGTYGNLGTLFGGKITLAPGLTKIDRVNFEVGDAAALPVAQFTEFTGSTVQVYSGNVSFSNVTKFDGSNAYAHNSSVTTYPALTSMNASPNFATYVQADNAATLNFPALTAINANTSHFLNFRTYSAGTINVPLVASVTTGYFELRAQDAGSMTNFPALTTLTFPSGSYGTIASYYTGKINVNAGYTALNAIDFHIDSNVGFPVAQLTSSQFSNIYVEGGSSVFTNLTSFEGNNHSLQTSGTGTSASFPALSSFVTNTASFSYIRAYGGSKLSAPNLTKIDTGFVDLRAQDLNSELDLPGLATLSFTAPSYGVIATYNGGKFNISPSYTSLNSIDFHTDSTNGFPVGQIKSANGSNISIEGGQPVFTNLASAVVNNNHITTYYAGTIGSFPALTSFVTNSSTFGQLRAFSGSTLSLPVLTKIDTGYVDLRAQDANSLLDMPTFDTLTFPINVYGNIFALYGGKIQTSANFKQLSDVNFYLDTTDGFPVGNLVTISRSYLQLSGGQPTFNNVTSIKGGRIETSGNLTIANFPAANSVIANTTEYTYLRAYTGSKLSMPAVTKIDTGYIELAAYNAGSILDLPGLTTVTPPLPTYGFVYAFSGGKINTAPNVQMFNLRFDFDDSATFNFANLQFDAGSYMSGYGKLPGNVVNAGFIDTEYYSPRTLEIAGNFTQTVTGEIRMDLNGTNKGVNYDWIKAGGAVQLDGKLTVQFMSYTPVLNDAFIPVSGASRSGNFSNFVNLIVGGGLELQPSVTATSAVLTTVKSAGPFVTGFTPTGNQFNVVTFADVTFNEPLDSVTFSTVDVTIAGPGGPYSPTSIQFIGGNSYRIHMPTLGGVGKYDVTVGPNITDIAGSSMDQDADGIFGEIPDDQYVASFTQVTADLVVQSINSIPVSANFGQTFNVTYTIRNDGNTATAGGWNDYVYLSADNVLDGGDQFVGFSAGPGLPIAPLATYNGTASVTLPLSPVQPDGNYFLIVVADGGGNLPEANESNNSFVSPTVAMKTPPRVVSFSVNNGAVQRSMVNTVSVTFNEVVNLPVTPANAFSLFRLSPGGPNAFVGLVASNVDNTGGQTKVTLTFQNGALYDGKSLIDGRYELKAIAGQITDASGLNLDGNANGITGDDYATNGVHRFFGDVDGDGGVSTNDFIQFRLALGGMNALFDYDYDGAVAASDFIQFRLRFGGFV